jgi:hypothetical protein
VERDVSTNSRPGIVLSSVLTVIRPLVRLLLRNGVNYPAFAQAIKRVFLEAAQAELESQGRACTDSAITLLSGVHRRDVRQLTRPSSDAASDLPTPTADAALRPQSHAPLGLVGEVVARWLSAPGHQDASGKALTLPRGGPTPSFDALVASVSRDVRPRAVLDEMLRLGVVSQTDAAVRLSADGFAPRHDLAEAASFFAANLHDHAAAAAANLHGEANFLEQAVHVDQLSTESVERLRAAARQAWQQAFKTVMGEAQARFDDDAANAAADQRNQRARFGVYFFSDREESK